METKLAVKPQEPRWTPLSQTPDARRLASRGGTSLIEAAMQAMTRAGAGAWNAKATVEHRGWLTQEETHGKPSLNVEPGTSMQVGQTVAVRAIDAAESFERLKANLWIRSDVDSMKVLLMIDATGGTGSSTAASNLASSLAQDGSTKVLLLDTTVRSHRDRFETHRLDDARGLEHLLAEPSHLQYPDGPSNLCFLAAHSPLPLSVFRSQAFDGFVRRVRELYDYVVIDSAPLADHPEVLLLAQRADGVILVIESERTRKQAALWAKKQIEISGGRLLGAVLTERRFRIPSWLYKRI